MDIYSSHDFPKLNLEIKLVRIWFLIESKQVHTRRPDEISPWLYYAVFKAEWGTDIFRIFCSNLRIYNRACCWILTYFRWCLLLVFYHVKFLINHNITIKIRFPVCFKGTALPTQVVFKSYVTSTVRKWFRSDLTTYDIGEVLADNSI